MSPNRKNRPGLDAVIVCQALVESIKKLSPATQAKNPVMFTVYVGSILTSTLAVQAVSGHGEAPFGFVATIAVWLWATVLFSNFAEAMAEGRGKAQAAALRGLRTNVVAKRLASTNREALVTELPADSLRRGDVVLVTAGDTIPCDGEILEGIASVDESAITGESAPVIREAGSDKSAVTGGTRLLSDWLVLRVAAQSGETFLDRMISLVEGA